MSVSIVIGCQCQKQEEVERGEKSISVDSLYHLASALDVPMALLVTLPGREPTPETAKLVGIADAGHSREELAKAVRVVRAVLEKAG